MTSADETKLLEQVSSLRQRIESQLAHRVIGQKDVIEQLLIALLAEGHVLLVGVPGLAKTLLVRTFADALSLQFGRIQFTPDLMPSDITGTEVLDETPSGKREFRFVRGPVFCNLLLADELNRTPPKTQAALLQAMQETSVTAGARTFDIPRPFQVFATQNPIEQAGTYPLPEAQLDRFMMQVSISYPDAGEELEIVRRTTVVQEGTVEKVMNREELVAIQRLIPTVPCADHLLRAAVQLVRLTRPDAEAPAEIRDNVTWGAGPRAARMLVLAAKARALLHGRAAVDVEDLRALAPAVLRHRLVLSFEADARGFTPDRLIEGLLPAIRP